MEHTIQYSNARRPFSKAGIASCATGLLVILHILAVAHYGLPVRASLALRWLMVGPFYVVAGLGVVLSIVAILRQCQLWWLGIPALLLNGLPLAVVVLLLFRRYA